MVATAIVAIGDGSREAMIPRWLSKVSIVGAIAIVCAGGPAFTQSGPFAYHGVLGFYVPMPIWGSLLEVHFWYMRRVLVAQMATADQRSVQLGVAVKVGQGRRSILRSQLERGQEQRQRHHYKHCLGDLFAEVDLARLMVKVATAAADRHAATHDPSGRRGWIQADHRRQLSG